MNRIRLGFMVPGTRKLSSFLGCVGLAFLAFILCGIFPSFGPGLTGLLTALGTYLTIYSGGNVIERQQDKGQDMSGRGPQG